MLTFGLIFWILMLFWIVYGVWGYWNPMPNVWYGHGMFLFVLFLLIGWHVFGQPIRP